MDLGAFSPITLEQMSGVRLMNRTDTKFVCTRAALVDLLHSAREMYYVQEIDNQRVMHYSTLYFDTLDYHMFSEHRRGRKVREKIRIRTYEDSCLSFLEVKKKNNKGRTKKTRMALPNSSHDILAYADFVAENSAYAAKDVVPAIENHFSRITLVNKQLTERLTIDTDLRFVNRASNKSVSLQPLVIIELKRDGLVPSPIMALLRRARIKPSGFSKYCIGMALTCTGLNVSGMKPKLRRINKLINQTN